MSGVPATSTPDEPAWQTTSTTDPVDPVRHGVQHALDRFLEHQRADLADVSPDLVPLVDAAADLVRGGKRLRPAFCYWGWTASGRNDADPIMTVGASLELFHAAALVHDDLIDAADTRRGLPSAHRRFQAMHTDGAWQGDSASFGRAAAILLGDLLLSWSDELFATASLPPGDLQAGRTDFDRMRTDVGGGQYLDVLEQARGRDQRGHQGGQAERARRVIRYKAARYSVEHPLVMGGRLAGASQSVLDGFAAYGSVLGEAFQLRDDILGVFGDPEVTGKPAGDDLREGKRTVLIAYALEQATPEQTATVERLLGDATLDDGGVAAVREVIVSTGALQRVEDDVVRLVEQAGDALAGLDVTDDGNAALTALIGIASSRTS